MIRYATRNDYAELRADRHISAEELMRAIDCNRILVFDDGGITAWLRYNLFWDNTPFMNMLFVLPNYRSMGLGTQLVINWENELAAKGYKTFLLSTPQNESSQHFYRKLGYNECGSFTLNCEPTELIMTKNI